jgi:hypothetical protein
MKTNSPQLKTEQSDKESIKNKKALHHAELARIIENIQAKFTPRLQISYPA